MRRRKVSPNPTDRGRCGSKINLMTDARGTPDIVRVDCGYTSEHLLEIFAWRYIEADIPQRGQEEVAGLGTLRWPIERTLSWLKQYRRGDRLGRERTAAIYEALVTLASAPIIYKQLAL